MSRNEVLEQYQSMKRELNSLMLEPLTKSNVVKQEKNIRSLVKKILKESVKIGVRLENVQGTFEPMNPFQALVIADELEEFKIKEMKNILNAGNIVVELGGTFPDGYIDKETKTDMSGKAPTDEREVALLMEVYKEAQEKIRKEREVQMEEMNTTVSEYKAKREEIKAQILEERETRKNLTP